MSNLAIIIIGVSGSGKTTVGEMLAAKTGYEFYDADNFHPQKNIDKMKAGHPLTDEDRWPWLDNMHDFITEKLKSNNVILACSGLKEIYRKRLSKGIEQQCKWVFLKGDYNTIVERMKRRKEHYMPASLLQSQFNDLQIPQDAIEADIKLPPGMIVNYIISKLSN